MKIGFFTAFKYEDDSNTLLIEAFKNHPGVESVTVLNSLEVVVNATADGVSFKFGDIELNKDNFDFVFCRRGFSDINITLQVVKYCQKNGIKYFDNNLHKVRYLINKKVDNITFALNNLSIPQTKVFSNLEQIKEFNFEFPLIVKAANSGKGVGVYRVNTLEEIISIVDDPDKKVNDFLFQEFIDYEMDLRVFVLGGEVLGAMRRIPVEGDFRANFSLGGSVEPIEATQEIKQLAIQAAKACDLEMAGIDVLVDKKGKLYILEANRTPGLTGISQALGINVGEKVVEYVLKNM